MNILIAEDDARTREGLRLALVRAGHRVIAAADGEAAVKLYQEEEPDIVCLDIMMPKMSGYEVCKTIRRADKRVPVLFLSAKSEEVDRVLGLELGADDFLSKPFGVPELLARIESGRMPQGVKAVIHLGACSSTTETDAEYVMQNNFRYSCALAEWAEREGCRFIYASSAATYGDGSHGFSDNAAMMRGQRPPKRTWKKSGMV